MFKKIKIINARLIKKNINLVLDDPNQSGFTNACCTTDNIYFLNAAIQIQRFKKKPFYVCFVDFTKAFDYVNRNALYYKLIQRSIKGKLLKIIVNMYEKAKCRVKWKKEVSNETDSQFGVLQGGMTSQKLFTDLLFDLKRYLDEKEGITFDDSVLNYMLYADDLVFCSETIEGLQKLLNGLFDFCKEKEK